MTEGIQFKNSKLSFLRNGGKWISDKKDGHPSSILKLPESSAVYYYQAFRENFIF